MSKENVTLSFVIALFAIFYPLKHFKHMNLQQF